jgi:serine/threonine protein phosphatase PrpC
MSYLNLFNIADANMIGKSHQRLMYNNQDAFDWKEKEGILVGVVCDGCGSHSHSEVGAKLGAKFITTYLINNYSTPGFSIAKLQAALEVFITKTARELSSDTTDAWRKVIEDYFLFTIVGFIIDENGTTFFYQGDGSILYNNEWIDLSTNNRPEYLAYNLLRESENLSFKSFHKSSPITNLLIATDGVQDILENAPAKDKFEAALKAGKVFENAIAFNQLLASDFVELIYDDTTLIFLQRKD